MKNLLTIVFVLSVLTYMGCSKKTASVQSEPSQTEPVTVKKAGVAKTIDRVASSPGSITFAAANERYSAAGKFNNWGFTKIDMKKGDVESLVATISIDLTSIWEKNDKLTAHLKAPDFFNIAKYSTAKMLIDNVEKTGDNTYKAAMTLDMKGLTQEMVSEFTVTSMDPLHVKGTAKVNRNLFGLGSVDMGVPELVEVTYDTDVKM